MKKIILNISLFAIGTALVSCGGTDKTGTETNQDSTAVVAKPDTMKNIVMYNIPSPIETFTILKMSGPSFDKSLTNAVGNLSKYSSNAAKAINLGVYSTDLSFCFLYKQNQDFNNYLKNINELTTALGIDGSYGQEVSKRLQANNNNLDSLMAIATEASVNADLYLKENQRNNTTVLIAAGSWVEAMHIITSIANKKQDQLITGLVADQKMSIKNLGKMLDQFPDDADMSAIAKDLKDIASVYDGLKPVQGNALVAEDKMLKSIGNNTTYDLTKDQLKMILDKVEALRNKLTN